MPCGILYATTHRTYISSCRPPPLPTSVFPLLYYVRMKSIAITGRLADLSIAELEALYGAKAITAKGDGFVVLGIDPNQVDFDRLGGTIKLARILTTLPTTDWLTIEKYLVKTVPKQAADMAEGKLTVGLSLYGIHATLKQLERTSLTLKKLIKQSGRPVRIVPNKALALSTPQVLHNHLTGDHGWELVFVQHDSQTLLCQTTNEQDIEAYTARDQARPRRDARVGMLPPKLAQTIVNLATGQTAINQDTRVLDPFCGTGVVLQEALLMGFNAYGTDIEPRMVEYSIDNIAWLRDWNSKASGAVRIEVGDATSHTWQPPVDAVAAETYLGEPLAVLPPREALERIISSVNQLHVLALKNLAKQLAPGTRLCLAVPAWRERSQFRHLPCLGNLQHLGFDRLSFSHVTNSSLLYFREDQIVARELIVLEKI